MTIWSRVFNKKTEKYTQFIHGTNTIKDKESSLYAFCIEDQAEIKYELVSERVDRSCIYVITLIGKKIKVECNMHDTVIKIK